MKMETISEMLIDVNHLMRLSAWEYLLNFVALQASGHIK